MTFLFEPVVSECRPSARQPFQVLLRTAFAATSVKQYELPHARREVTV